jgi:hypothetical protein
MTRGYDRHDGPVRELHVQVPEPTKERVWRAAKAADLSPSQWLRRAIREQLTREAGR